MPEQAWKPQRFIRATKWRFPVADLDRERIVERETVVVDASDRGGGGGVIAAIALLIVVLAVLYYFGMLPI
jgi:hypothetical protein